MQSSASTYGTLWEASDLLVDTALRAPKPVDGLFAAARSGKYGFDRHPRMDSTNTTGLLGYAMTFGKTQTGVFLEMGHADYETDSPTSTGRVTGDGDHNYAGAGVFVSQELIPDLHATAYVKGGVLRNAFDVTIAGKKLDFNRTSAYWGAHLGVHYDWALSQSFDARAYASYFYDGREKETYKKAGTTDVVHLRRAGEPPRSAHVRAFPEPQALRRPRARAGLEGRREGERRRRHVACEAQHDRHGRHDRDPVGGLEVRERRGHLRLLRGRQRLRRS